MVLDKIVFSYGYVNLRISGDSHCIGKWWQIFVKFWISWFDTIYKIHETLMKEVDLFVCPSKGLFSLVFTVTLKKVFFF